MMNPSGQDWQTFWNLIKNVIRMYMYVSESIPADRNLHYTLHYIVSVNVI